MITEKNILVLENVHFNLPKILFKIMFLIAYSFFLYI